MRGSLHAFWDGHSDSIFIPARVTDNAFNNPEYTKVLQNLTGWQKRAWLDGDWDLAAGQFFTTFRRDIHVVCDPPSQVGLAVPCQPLSPLNSPGSAGSPQPASPTPERSDVPISSIGKLSPFNYFDPTRAREWFCALDYGFTHYTVVLLGCTDGDGNTFVVDEHAERLWLPQRHAAAIKAMLRRHNISLSDSQLPQGRAGSPLPAVPDPSSINHQLPQGRAGSPLPAVPDLDNFQLPAHRSLGEGGSTPSTNSQPARVLARFVAGTDVFSRQSDGTTIAQQYAREGIKLRPANTDRINGWAEILQLLGDPDAGLRPTLFIHECCARLLETLPSLQHDPNRPEDVLKIDADEDGIGGDDAADALRYLVATKPRTVSQRKLSGL